MHERVLITGADGLLGSHVVRRALAQGYRVRAFLQPDRNTGTLDGLEIERLTGDLTNPADIEKAIDGCDYLIHTAASTSVWPSRSRQTWKINYDAVVNLAALVQKYKIKRFVNIGSGSSFGFGSKKSPGGEESPFLGAKYQLDYIDSKQAAQDYLLECHQRTGLPVIIVAPTYLIGEYDTKPSSGKMVIAVCRHMLPVISAGGRCIAYAGDVAQAVVNALTMGRPGECYIAGGENLSYREFFGLIAERAHTTAPRIVLPTPVIVGYAALLEMAARINQNEPMLTIPMAKISGDGHYYRSDKAIRELGLPQTGTGKAIERTIEYFKTIGYL
jgi:dihydroflavonol-4-reductase